EQRLSIAASPGVLDRTFEIVDNREQVLEDRLVGELHRLALLPCSPLLQVFEVGALALPPLLVAAGLFPGGLQLGFERLDPGLRGGTWGGCRSPRRLTLTPLVVLVRHDEAPPRAGRLLGVK